MICGDTPFYSSNMDQTALFKNICRGKFRYPKGFTEDAKSIISKILVVRPSRRLGCLAGGHADIINEKWFNDIDFKKLLEKELPAPWVPKIKDPFDTKNFDDWSCMAKDFDHCKAVGKRENEFF